MADVFEGRWSGVLDDDFVVFLIGMRINKPWKVHKWLPVAKSMRPMQVELMQNTDLGCMHIENWFGRTTMSVQYWTDAESLNRYATGEIHLPAWRAFNKAIRNSGDVGIWHETFQVKAGQYETIYGNMPRFGLASAGKHMPTSEVGQSARRRLGADADEPSVTPY